VGEANNSCTVSVGRSKGGEPFGSPKTHGRIVLTLMVLKYCVCIYGLGSSGSGRVQVQLKFGNNILGCIKGRML
jgi:hypothetical protein